MRLDKYLKTSRLIKRRVIAKTAASDDYVLVNNQTVKPSYQVKVSDIIEIKYAFKSVVVKVTSLDNKTDALMYKLIAEKKTTT